MIFNKKYYWEELADIEEDVYYAISEDGLMENSSDYYEVTIIRKNEDGTVYED